MSRLGRFLAVLLAAACITALPAAARMPTERERGTFRQGNAEYEAGRFAEAAAAYESLVKGGTASRDLYYNLGNAYLKVGRLGPAILNFRRALLIDPADEDARANLAYARRRTQDSTPQEAVDPLPWLTALRPGSDRAGFLFLVAFNLCALFFGAWRMLSRPPAFLKPLFGVLAGLTVLFGLVFFYEGRAEAENREVVVVAPASDVKSGPGADYTVAFVVHEGTEARLGRSASGWVEITVTPELKGWVPAGVVERIE